MVKRLKPASRQSQIYIKDGAFEPDFVVETHTAKFLIGLKRSDPLSDSDVAANAHAAVRWCGSRHDPRVGK